MERNLLKIIKKSSTDLEKKKNKILIN